MVEPLNVQDSRTEATGRATPRVWNLRRSGIAVALLLLVASFQPAAGSDAPSDTALPGAVAASFYAEDVAAAAQALVDATPAEQREQLVFPFDSPNRTSGRDTSLTPSFCAVVQWCPEGWGLTVCELNQDQRIALNMLLDRALSPGGYQTVRTIINSNRVNGELEEVADHPQLDGPHADPDTLAVSIFDLLSPDREPADDWYPIVGGARTHFDGTTVIDWSWPDPPGLEGRLTQVCNYAIALFGEPGTAPWSLRFEGHHLHVNITFESGPDGQVVLYGTPLFLGGFPMVVPSSPFASEDISLQWGWTEGQMLMYSTVHHLRNFWLAVPEEVRTAAFIDSSHFEQSPPLLLDTPPSNLIAALLPVVDPEAVTDNYPHTQVLASALSPEAVWHLRQAFGSYARALNDTIGDSYLARFDAALAADASLTLAWAGGPLDEFGSHHYSHVLVGDLLVELLQSNQYSVQHDPDIIGNHVHSMMRDLQFGWAGDPLRAHLEHYH